MIEIKDKDGNVIAEVASKEEENVFKARSYVPQTFWTGFGITFFYCVVLLVASYFLLKRMIYR